MKKELNYLPANDWHRVMLNGTYNVCKIIRRTVYSKANIDSSGSLRPNITGFLVEFPDGSRQVIPANVFCNDLPIGMFHTYESMSRLLYLFDVADGLFGENDYDSSSFYESDNDNSVIVNVDHGSVSLSIKKDNPMDINSVSVFDGKSNFSLSKYVSTALSF